MNTDNSPAVYTTGNGNHSDGLAGAALAMAMTNRGYSYDPVSEVAASGICDLRSEVRDVEADVKDAIQSLSNKTTMEAFNLHNRLCESEKAAIEAKFAGMLETKAAVEKLTAEIDHCCEEQTEALSAFRLEVKDQFCAIERRELEREIKALQAAALEASNAKQTADIIAALSGNNGNGNN